MKHRLPLLCLTALLVVFSACSSEPAAPAADTPANSAAPAAAPSGDPLSGTWSGDWGPDARDRNDVTLELKYDGTALTGTVNPTTQAIPLKSASYAPDTGVVKMEADAPGRGGTTVHFMIDGKLEGNTMSGSWTHDDKKGDFKITKK